MIQISYFVLCKFYMFQGIFLCDYNQKCMHKIVYEMLLMFILLISQGCVVLSPIISDISDLCLFIT